MSVVLYHHPWSRAATVLAVLEEVGIPYELVYVDLRAGEQKTEAHRALNPMGKIPVLVDGEAVIAETSAITMYLADRYAPGRLAPALDDPARGAYLRWCVFPAAVIEPASMAKAGSWPYRASAAGFGTYDEMLATLRAGLAPGPWLLGERFTAADVLVAASLRWMLRFGMIAAEPALTAYVERYAARPAVARADARNAAIAEAHGLTM